MTVSLGTETDGSILCLTSYNSVVGIKPRMDQIIPPSPRQDIVGYVEHLSIYIYINPKP